MTYRTHRLGPGDIGRSLASDHVPRGGHCGGSGSEKRSNKHCECTFVCWDGVNSVDCFLRWFVLGA